MTTCTRTDAHPLSECAERQPEPVAGQYARLRFDFHQPAGVEHVEAVVLITSTEQRDDYRYVTWTNASPGGGWHPRLGSFGAFRWGWWGASHVRVLEVLPLRQLASARGPVDEPVGGGHDEYQHLRESAAATIRENGGTYSTGASDGHIWNTRTGECSPLCPAPGGHSAAIVYDEEVPAP